MYRYYNYYLHFPLLLVYAHGVTGKPPFIQSYIFHIHNTLANEYCLRSTNSNILPTLKSLKRGLYRQLQLAYDNHNLRQRID